MIFLYLFLFSILSIYTFSQVDLNLNLSQNSSWLLFENQMKYLGFYNRPLSFWIFVILSLTLIILYSVILVKILKKNYVLRITYYVLLIPFFLYFFAYPAFLSYDIFNYLFDAKILTKYYQNPYFHFALQYKFDTWTRFMRWTTRTYPYGPIWLLLTAVPVFLGFDKLVLTILTFKIFNLAVFMGCLKIMQLILKKINKPVEWIYAFALNPVIIYDFLISMHNESLMLLFLLMSIYFFVGDDLMVVPQNFARNRILSLIFLALSIGVKYMTAIFFPIYVAIWLYEWYHACPSEALAKEGRSSEGLNLKFFSKIFRSQNPFTLLINLGTFIYFLAIIFLASTREFYSWYFIVPIALLVLNFSKTKAIVLIVLSFLILRYSPFILIGEYNKTVIFWQNWISYAVMGIIFGIFLISSVSFPRRRES
jgi:hypothetical protein